MSAASPLFPYTTLFRSRKTGLAQPDKYPPRRYSSAGCLHARGSPYPRSEQHTSELQSRFDLVCRLLHEKKIRTNMTDASKIPGTSFKERTRAIRQPDTR